MRLSSLTVKQLRKLAKKRCVKNYSGKTKKDLILSIRKKIVNCRQNNHFGAVLPCSNEETYILYEDVNNIPEERLIIDENNVCWEINELKTWWNMNPAMYGHNPYNRQRFNQSFLNEYLRKTEVLNAQLRRQNVTRRYDPARDKTYGDYVRRQLR